ncbi:putative tail tubular protein [Vibrio phage VPMCC14]|nr:putative tail tubular protein [Vibrio phage VPMCC14]
MPTYPATNSVEASALLVDASNKMHEIVNEDALTEITTESGPVPSVRKALADTFLFVEPIAWNQGSNEETFNQLRTFGDETYWAPTASLANPVPMGVTPVGDSNWKLAPTGKNESIIKQWDTEAQEDLLPLGSSLFKGDDGDYLKDGDTVPAGNTHLRVLIGGKPTIIAMSPVASGTVSLLTEISATIGTTPVSFYSPLTANFSSVDDMLAAQTMVGGRYCTGNTDWKKTDDSNGNILDFEPLNALHIDDFGVENINTMFTLGADIIFGHNKVYTFDTLWRGIQDNITINLNKSTIRRGDSLIGGDFSYSPESQFLLVDGEVIRGVTIENGTFDMRIHEFDEVMNVCANLNTGGRLIGWSFKNIVGIDVRTICTSYNNASGMDNILVEDCEIVSTIPILIAQKVPYAIFAGVQVTNTTVRKCKTDKSSFHLAIFDSDVAQAYPCSNNLIEECRAIGTYDTSIYFYGDGNTARDNYIEDAGKDALKVNATTYHESKNNFFINNEIVGGAGLVQSDGGVMIVLAGRNNVAAYNKCRPSKEATAIAYTPTVIVTEGFENRVEFNHLENESEFRWNMVAVKQFANSITPEEGQVVRGNYIRGKLGYCLSFDASGVYFARVEDNDFDFSDIGMYIERTLADPAMISDDLYMTLKNNKFNAIYDGVTEPYSILASANISKVFYSGNVHKGYRQRDLRSNVGFVGVDNRADENMDSVFINNWSVVPSGSKFTVIPTYGTWGKGDVVGDGVDEFKCTDSGTQGTLTGVTASTTAGSKTITLNSTSAMQYGKFISLAGETGKFCVSEVIDSTTIKVNKAPTNTATGVSVDFYNATFVSIIVP